MRARRSGGVARHAGNAAVAAFTAASISSAFANGTVRTTSPVEALVTLPLRELRDEVRCPSIQSGTLASSSAASERVALSICVAMPLSSVHRRP